MSDISLSVNNNVAGLKLDRPDVYNALSPELLMELIDLCKQLAANESVSVVVLEGAGKHFCAGADLPRFNERMQTDAHGTVDLGRRATEAIAALPQVVIAAIKGHCIGGGLVLSAACDMRVAADNSRFSIPELDAGIAVAWGGMAHLARVAGETAINDFVLSGEPFDAHEALRTGLISRIYPVDKFDESLAALAERVASKPAIVLRQTKRKLQSIRAGSFDGRDDAADAVESQKDPEAMAVNKAYIRKHIGR